MINYIELYNEKIQSGEIVTSKRVKKVYARLVEDIKHHDKYEFDIKKATHPIKFIETFCKHSEGKVGTPFKLELFQKAFIQAIFGFIEKDTGYRRYREAFFLVARKNGKSSLLSGIMLYMLIADKEGAAQIVSAATKLDQASIVFKNALNMVSQSPDLREVLTKRKTDLYYPETFSVMKPLASDSKTLDGLNIHLAVADELHEWKERDLYYVIKQGMSSRKQPLFIVITTSGTRRENIFDDIYEYASKVADGIIKDDKYLPIMYELDSKEEWTNPNMWMKANPGLDIIKKREYIQDEVNRAVASGIGQKEILCKDFNIRETAEETWLSFDELNNEETFDIEEFRGSYALGGTDLSSVGDLTAATLLLKRDNKFYIHQHYFIPRSQAEKKEHSDKVPYSIWEKRGLITFCDGEIVQYSDITKWYIKMTEEYQIIPLKIGYDRAMADYWVQEMQTYGYSMDKVAQGAFTFSQPMKIIKGLLAEKKINYNNNPILKWNLTNVEIVRDNNDNIRPIKKNPNKRIDGFVSMLDAFVIYERHAQDFENMI